MALRDHVSAFCSIAGHVACRQHGIARCSCPCHHDEAFFDRDARSHGAPGARDPVFVRTKRAQAPETAPATAAKRPRSGAGPRRSAGRRHN